MALVASQVQDILDQWCLEAIILFCIRISLKGTEHDPQEMRKVDWHDLAITIASVSTLARSGNGCGGL